MNPFTLLMLLSVVAAAALFIALLLGGGLYLRAKKSNVQSPTSKEE